MGKSSDEGSYSPSPQKYLTIFNLQKRIYSNKQIRANNVRLIDETGQQLGVVSLKEALQKAEEKGLDLIQVTEKVDPPVVRIGDQGKYLYQQEKKERESRKHSGGDLKEVRLGFNISDHDMETRLKQAIGFLTKGHRIRPTLPLRGRQKAREDHARQKFDHFITLLQEQAEIKFEREVKKEPRGLSAIITTLFLPSDASIFITALFSISISPITHT